MGAKFDSKTRNYVFSVGPHRHQSHPALNSSPRHRPFRQAPAAKGKNIWMMGGGEIIASFLDEGAIDEFIISVIPTFIGDGIPLIARRHRDVPLRLRRSTLSGWRRPASLPGATNG